MTMKSNLFDNRNEEKKEDIKEGESVEEDEEDEEDEEGEDEDDNVCISSTPLMFFRLLSAQYTRFWWRIYP